MSPKARLAKVSSAVKLAKSILSQDRENLFLWDGYARLERKRGNIAAARAVYGAALQASLAARDAGKVSEDEMDLWVGWAEMEYELGETGRCLEVLLMASGLDLAKLGMASYTGARFADIDRFSVAA
jgi:hypothetical protein